MTRRARVRMPEVEEGIDIIDRAMTDATRGLVSDRDLAPFMMW